MQTTCLQTFNNHGDPLTTADTQRCQPGGFIALLQRVNQRYQNPCAACANWMPQRDRAAIDVHFLLREIEFASNRQILCGKGFVGFD